MSTTPTKAHHSLIFHPLTVADVRPETDEAVVITFSVPRELAEEYGFSHGQHLTLRRYVDGQELRRSYSICSPAGGPLRVAVKRVRGGLFSTWANQALRPGERVEAMPPTGSFTCDLDPASSRHYVAIAAGSGITPILSIVATVLAREPHSTVSLLYINQTAATTMFVEELEGLKDRYLQRLQLWYVFTREPGEVELLSGRPDRARLDQLVAAEVLPSDAHCYFLCGPLSLVDNARAALTTAGVSGSRIKTELFGTGSVSVRTPPPRPAEAAALATVTATLNGRASTFPVGEGEHILDAARRVRSDVPYSCTAGVCATCRALVLEGKVEMDVQYGLEPDEVAAGYVLTCQARPCSSEVRLDYDA